MDQHTLATQGANAEASFHDLRSYTPEQKFTLNSTEFTVIDTLKYTNAEGHSSIKAIAYRDSAGNVFFHFNGTGDANWEENAVNYGVEPNPSDLQKSCLSFADNIMGKYPDSTVYITGHSQGGNNAQFVTMRSQHGDRIATCVSLDGPGFSSKFVANTKNMFGEDHFNAQRNKIYAYNGESDYVSCLGQEQLVPEDHVTLVKTPKDPEDSTNFMIQYHLAEYLLDEHGNLNQTLNESDESDFRKLVKALNEKVLQLPPDEQARAAALTMKLIEYLEGDVRPVLTPQELAEFKELLIPLLVDTLADQKELLPSVLSELGLDPATTELIVAVVGEFNSLSEADRQKMLEYIAQCVVITEDGTYGLDITELFNDGSDIGTFLTTVIPIVWETIIHNPDTVMDVIQEHDLDNLLAEYLSNHPLIAGALVILAPTILKFVGKAAVVIAAVEILAHAAEFISETYEKVKDFVVNCIQFIREWCKALESWWRETFEKGVKYAAENPYFKVDTDKLSQYAYRVYRVKSRLSALDRDLNSLYWQVGFLDLWDLLMTDLLTGGTSRLAKVENYLNNSATRFERAERTAQENMGG